MVCWGSWLGVIGENEGGQCCVIYYIVWLVENVDLLYQSRYKCKKINIKVESMLKELITLLHWCSSVLIMILKLHYEMNKHFTCP